MINYSNTPFFDPAFTSEATHCKHKSIKTKTLKNMDTTTNKSLHKNSLYQKQSDQHLDGHMAAVIPKDLHYWLWHVQEVSQTSSLQSHWVNTAGEFLQAGFPVLHTNIQLHTYKIKSTSFALKPTMAGFWLTHAQIFPVLRQSSTGEIYQRATAARLLKIYSVSTYSLQTLPAWQLHVGMPSHRNRPAADKGWFGKIQLCRVLCRFLKLMTASVPPYRCEPMLFAAGRTGEVLFQH